MVTTAVLSALAVILTWAEIQIGATGGSINFVMLPIIVIAYRYGALWGVSSGLIVGLAKCIIGGGIGWGLPSILLDYVLAYGAVGLAGLVKKGKWRLELAALVGAGARYLIHFISGVTIYKIVASETILGVTTSSAFLYSVLYNALYMVPSTVAVVIMLSLLKKPLDKYLNK